MALDQVTTSTEFGDTMEHDFPFIEEIDHELLVTSMHEFQELRIVRFNKRGDWARKDVNCTHTITVAGTDYFLDKWSNNNHFTTKEYYDWLFHEIGSALRPTESKMMFMQQHSSCTLYGQYLLVWVQIRWTFLASY